MYYSTIYNSPIGDIQIVSDGESILKVSFIVQKDNYIFNDDLDIFQKSKKYLNQYFKGKQPELNFKLNPQGTPFRLKVWKILMDIHYGEIKTYGEIAREISPTMSAQAVGGAVGANPIVILIPCHRVLGKNNKLTGYSEGIDKKIKLLNIENISWKD